MHYLMWIQEKHHHKNPSNVPLFLEAKIELKNFEYYLIVLNTLFSSINQRYAQKMLAETFANHICACVIR